MQNRLYWISIFHDFGVIECYFAFCIVALCFALLKIDKYRHQSAWLQEHDSWISRKESNELTRSRPTTSKDEQNNWTFCCIGRVSIKIAKTETKILNLEKIVVDSPCRNEPFCFGLIMSIYLRFSGSTMYIFYGITGKYFVKQFQCILLDCYGDFAFSASGRHFSSNFSRRHHLYFASFCY